jgi:hypothetical protein
MARIIWLIQWTLLRRSWALSALRSTASVRSFNLVWSAGRLSLISHIQNVVKFTSTNKLAVDIHISYKADIINNTSSTNCLGLTLDSTLTWKTHIKQLSSKLHSACYLIRSLRSVISTNNLRTIYFSYVHSIMMYSIIFGGSSPYSDNIF